LQQPSEQLVALQAELLVQAPPEQVWPLEQVLHGFPSLPHAAVVVPGWQLSPLQQPAQMDEQGGGSAHVWLEQTCPVEQTSQGLPSLPQLSMVWPPRQVVPSQQPSGQVPALHTASVTHSPSGQDIPAAQLRQATPSLPHKLGSLPTSQTFPEQQPLQLVGSQIRGWEHACPEHCSPAGQVTQARPPLPQASFVSPATQSAPRQQPEQVAGPHGSA